jgi:hypothetical protein
MLHNPEQYESPNPSLPNSVQPAVTSCRLDPKKILRINGFKGRLHVRQSAPLNIQLKRFAGCLEGMLRK